MKNLLRYIFIKKFWLKAILSFVLFTASVFGSNYYIVYATKTQIVKDINSVPTKKVAVVLGAAKLLRNQIRNPYFYNRIKAAATLYHAGKVSHFLVTGDNHSEHYNEPEDMKFSLMELGVPDSCITMDFAGFRTFDSMVRAKEIFGVTDCIIVSQEFHLQRALFIANSLGMKVVGYPAKGVGYRGLNLREFGAKFKAALDCYVLPTKPRFLGKKEVIQ